MTAAITVPGRYYRVHPRPDMLGYAEESLALPIDETVFLLVDVYGPYDHEPEPDAGAAAAGAAAAGAAAGGAGDRPRTRRTESNGHAEIVRERIAPAKAAARRAGLRIVYVTNRLRAGLSAGNEWRTMSVRTHGIDVLETWQEPAHHLGFANVIAPAAGEPVVEKQVFSGFFETNLDSVLRGYRARNLVVVGGDGMICLGTTVIDAMYRNYRVVALRDCVITNEYPDTRAAEWASFMAIRQIETTVGYTITTQQFIAACDAVAAAQAR
jgi:nicotinamidase-related amidase